MTEPLLGLAVPANTDPVAILKLAAVLTNDGTYKCHTHIEEKIMMMMMMRNNLNPCEILLWKIGIKEKTHFQGL